MDYCANAARLEDTCRRLLAGRATPNQLIADGEYLIDATLKKLVRRFGSAASRLADDLRSIGNLELVRISNKPNLDPATISRRLGSRIRNAMRDALQSEGCITPARRQRDGIEAHRCESLSDTAAGRIAAPSDNSGELLEEALAACSDDVDRQIVNLRAESRSDAEVSTLVGLSESAVRRRRQAIEARFVERNPEYALSL